MRINRIVGTIYFVLTVYIIMVTGTTNLDIMDVFLALLFMWINYIFFYLGSKTKHSSKNRETFKHKNWVLNLNKNKLLILGLSSVLASLVAAQYYTGQTIIEVISNMLNDVSVYYEYQNYFSQAGIGSFSLTKIPFILMLFYVKALFIYSFLSFLITKDKVNSNEIVYLILVGFSHLYIGIARGTSFEFFEFILLMIYIALRKYSNKIFSLKNVRIALSVIIIGLIGIFLFRSRIEDRGVVFNISSIAPEIIYDSNGWLNQLLPFFSFLVLTLYNYFGYGFYYISRFINEFWFSSFKTTVAGLIPQGFTLIDINEELQFFIMDDLLKGARWNPDFVAFISQWGYILLLIFCLILGIIGKNMGEKNSYNTMSEVTNYFVLLQMISFPIGHFVAVSSANLLIIMSLITYWLWKLFVGKKLVIKKVK